MRRAASSGIAVCLAVTACGPGGESSPEAAGGVPDATAAVFPYAAPESTGVSSDALRNLADDIAGWVSAGDPVGAELLIVKDGHAIFHEAWGWSDREEGRPLEPNSIYRIRSMTKPFVGTSILMLMEEGRLSLDDRAADYIPAFDHPGASEITIRELLTHTAGLAGNDVAYPRSLSEYASLRELVDHVGEVGATGTRGEFMYSDRGSAALGAIVEVVSGMPVERFIEERILAPLELDDTHTAFVPDTTWADRMNSTYALDSETCGFERYWDPSREQVNPFFRSSGGIYSTTTDYARFLSVWMDRGRTENGRRLDASSVEMALTPYGDRGFGMRYGMQWAITNDSIRDGLPRVFEHGGSDGTVAMAIPELDAMVLFYTQSRRSGVLSRFVARLGAVEPFDGLFLFTADPSIEADWSEIVEEGGEDLEALARARAGELGMSADDLERYSGTYESEDGGMVQSVSFRDGLLRVEMLREPSAGLMVPVSEGVFVQMMECASMPARRTFEVAGDGSVTGFAFDVADGFAATLNRSR